MKGYLIMMAGKAINKVCDIAKRDIEDSSHKGKIPITVCVLSGVLIGSLIAGFAGAVVGGIAGAVLRDVFMKAKTVASAD